MMNGSVERGDFAAANLCERLARCVSDFGRMLTNSTSGTLAQVGNKKLPIKGMHCFLSPLLLNRLVSGMASGS